MGVLLPLPPRRQGAAHDLLGHFGASFADDRIEAFAAGAGSDDRIELSAFGIGLGNLTFQQSGSDTVITAAAFAGNKITLVNITVGSLHADDSVF